MKEKRALKFISLRNLITGLYRISIMEIFTSANLGHRLQKYKRQEEPSVRWDSVLRTEYRPAKEKELNLEIKGKMKNPNSPQQLLSELEKSSQSNPGSL